MSGAKKLSPLCFSAQHGDDVLLHGTGSGHDASAVLPLLSGLRPAELHALRRNPHIAGHDPHTLQCGHPHQLLQAAVRQDHHKG